MELVGGVFGGCGDAELVEVDVLPERAVAGAQGVAQRLARVAERVAVTAMQAAANAAQRVVGQCG